MLRLFSCAGSESDNMLVRAAEVDGAAASVLEPGAVADAWVVGRA